jgi:hypothetical protein
MIKLNETQKSEVLRIFGRGAFESTLHIRKILSTGRNLFTRAGTEVTLKMARKRRKHCMKICNQASRGFVV